MGQAHHTSCPRMLTNLQKKKKKKWLFPTKRITSKRTILFSIIKVRDKSHQPQDKFKTLLVQENVYIIQQSMVVNFLCVVGRGYSRRSKLYSFFFYIYKKKKARINYYWHEKLMFGRNKVHMICMIALQPVRLVLFCIVNFSC